MNIQHLLLPCSPFSVRAKDSKEKKKYCMNGRQCWNLEQKSLVKNVIEKQWQHKNASNLNIKKNEI